MKIDLNELNTLRKVTDTISAINEQSEEAQRSNMEIYLFKYDFHNDPDKNGRQNVLGATSPKRASAGLSLTETAT